DLTKQTGEFGLLFVLIRAGSPSVQRFLDGFSDPGIPVAQQSCPMTGAEIDVFFAIQVPEPAAFRAVKEHGMTEGPVQARGRRHSAGEELAGLLVLFDNLAHRRDSLTKYVPGVFIIPSALG